MTQSKRFEWKPYCLPCSGVSHFESDFGTWSTLLIDEKTNQSATEKASQHGNWKGRGWKTQTDTSDEDDRFKSFTKNRDEWQDEQGVLLAPALETTTDWPASGAVFGFEGFCELDTPFILEFRNAQESCSHGSDDQ